MAITTPTVLDTEIDFLLDDLPDVAGTLRQLREETPALWGRAFGEPALVLLSHELVQGAFKAEDIFPSAAFYGEVVTDVLGRNLQCMQGEEHRLNRALVSPAFRQRLMPGLVEPHAHLSFADITSYEMTRLPPEEHLLATFRNARTMLDSGYTSAVSAAAAKPRLDVVVKREIEAGRFPGPRLLANGPEITVTGGLGDTNRLHLPYNPLPAFAWVADGPDEVRRVCRTLAREGVDLLKLNLSGDKGTSSADSEETPMTTSLLLLAALVVPAGAEITAGGQTVRVQFYAPDGVRVLKWAAGGSPEKQSLVVIARPDVGLALTRSETAEAMTLASSRVQVRISKTDGVVRFETPEGSSVLAEAGAASFTPVTTPFENAWSVAQVFRLTPEEGIYGLGQHQDGFMNYRGRAVKLVQTNTDAVTPVVVSTGGWGLLWDNDSKTQFSDGPQGASLWSEVADNVDYTFFYGPSLDAVIGGYRRLTGEAPRRFLRFRDRDRHELAVARQRHNRGAADDV